MSGFIRTPVDRRLVAACAVGQGLFIGLVGSLVGVGNPYLAFLGIPAGLVTGVLTRPHGPALRNGLYVAGVGLPLAVVFLSGYGFVLSVSMGLGLDSVVSFGISIYTVAIAAIVGPFHAITGAVAADRANVLRRWLASAA